MLSQQIVSLSRGRKRVLRDDREKCFHPVLNQPTNSRHKPIRKWWLLSKLKAIQKFEMLSAKHKAFDWFKYLWTMALLELESSKTYNHIDKPTTLSRSLIRNTIDLNKLMWNRSETGSFHENWSAIQFNSMERVYLLAPNTVNWMHFISFMNESSGSTWIRKKMGTSEMFFAFHRCSNGEARIWLAVRWTAAAFVYECAHEIQCTAD